MGRTCAQCDYYKDSSKYSNNQWRKGDGYSRCMGCVSGYQCHTCNRSFDDANQLEMHLQTHRPRNVSCPLCGVTKFRSGANAVQHVESGYCCGGGREIVRQQIYDFARKQRAMQRYMSDNNNPRITFGSWNYHEIPEYPYRCPDCSREFQNLSQLLQHRDNKHGHTRLLTYY